MPIEENVQLALEVITLDKVKLPLALLITTFGSMPCSAVPLPVRICAPVPLMVMVAEPPPLVLVLVFVTVISPWAWIAPVLS